MHEVVLFRLSSNTQQAGSASLAAEDDATPPIAQRTRRVKVNSPRRTHCSQPTATNWLKLHLLPHHQCRRVEPWPRPSTSLACPSSSAAQSSCTKIQSSGFGLLPSQSLHEWPHP